MGIALGPVLGAAPALAEDPSNLPGSIYDPADALTPEQEADAQEQIDALREEIASRPGWDGMTALAQGNVAIANGWATSALGKSIGALYLGSWLHPQEMDGVDPDRFLTRWVTEFQDTALSDPADYVQGPGA